MISRQNLSHYIIILRNQASPFLFNLWLIENDKPLQVMRSTQFVKLQVWVIHRLRKNHWFIEIIAFFLHPYLASEIILKIFDDLSIDFKPPFRERSILRFTSLRISEYKARVLNWLRDLVVRDSLCSFVFFIRVQPRVVNCRWQIFFNSRCSCRRNFHDRSMCSWGL